jgi:ribosomal protein L37AE/L43A
MTLPETYAPCPRCRQSYAVKTKTGEWYCPDCDYVWRPVDAKVQRM